MLAALSNFHWLRPEWFFALIPFALLLVVALYKQRQLSQWDQLIPSDLLAPLLVGGQRQSNGKWLTLLGLLWLISTVALAGPSWEKLPQPVSKSQQAIIVLLDLSPSMLAQDVKPSRLIRSRYKLIDLLKARQDGLTGLIAYAGDAHVVTPLTDDTETIISLLPALDPSTMPVPGSQVEQALSLGLQLMRDSGIAKGQFLLITDGVAESAADKIADTLADTSYTLSVLAIGTEEGAPIPLPNGFAKDNTGNIVISKLDIAALQTLAQQNGGRFSTLAADNQDIDFLISLPSTDIAEQSQRTDRLFDTWQDNGAYLCLLLLPFAAFAFRRGFILVLLIGIFSAHPEAAFAQHNGQDSNQAVLLETSKTQFSAWDKLWATPDQRGQKLLTDGLPEEAAKQFETPEWKASALYSAGKFDAAAEEFSGETATDYYNRGNALAQAGQLEQAIAAYDKALELTPNMDDAQFNKKIVEERLKKQQEQDGQESGDDQQQGDQQKSDQQKGDQQNNQQQNQNSGNNNTGENTSENQPGSNDQTDSKQNQQGNQNDDSSESQADLPDNADAENTDKEQPNPYSEQSETSKAQNGGEEEKEEPKEQQASAQQQDLQQDETNNEQAFGQIMGEPSPEDSEQAQALEQWLRQVPDDPSGLLRQKFNYEYRLRQRQQQWQQPSLDESRL